MATCIYCNAQIQDGLKFCTNCGAALPVEAPTEVQAEVLPQQPNGQPYQQGYQQPGQQGYQQPGYQQPFGQNQPAYTQAPASYDSGHIGWGILGFFIPIVGVVLYFVWRTDKPKCAKVAGIGAIIGFCVNLVLNFSVLML